MTTSDTASATSPSPRSLLRRREVAGSGRVAYVELFFDLVFVFAITQLSHGLLAHLDLHGAIHTAILLVAVWWVWIYTTWVTNWLDPERLPVRLALFAQMLLGLLMSVAIPRAFEDRGLVFVAGYAGMHIGRTLFVLWAVRGESVPFVRNFQRIFVWLLLASLAWLAGAFAEGIARTAWWCGAIAIELTGPFLNFRVPGLGASRTQEWNIDAHHMAERCALLIIIALGESLLITGATYADIPWTVPTSSGFLSAALGAIVMWWLYFDTGAERSAQRLHHGDDPGRLARSAYTYLHAPILAGIVVTAVADELVLAHPDHATPAGLWAILGGPALFVAANALFKWLTNDRLLPPFSHLGGLLALGALTLAAGPLHLSALALSWGTTLIVAGTALWEVLALRRPAAHAAHS